MARYRTKPVEVTAERYEPGQPLPAGVMLMWGSYYLPTDTGALLVNPGDYIVTLPNGFREVLDTLSFQNEFEPVVEKVAVE